MKIAPEHPVRRLRRPGRGHRAGGGGAAPTSSTWTSWTATSCPTSPSGRRSSSPSGSATRLPLDVHLMIEEPERWVETYVEGGRGLRHRPRRGLRRTSSATLALIREAGARPGVALNPSTPARRARVRARRPRPGAGHVGQPGLRRPVLHPHRLREDPPAAGAARRAGPIAGLGGRRRQGRAMPGLWPQAGATVLVAGSAIFGAAGSGRRAGRPAECVGSTEKGLTFSCPRQYPLAFPQTCPLAVEHDAR